MNEARPVSSIIAKVIGPCNLNCSYCYVYNHADHSHRERPARMAQETWEALIQRMREYCELRPGHRMSLVLHGGEPLLIGKTRLSRMVRHAQSVLGDRLKYCSIQTNATMIDEGWAELLAELEVNVAISIDGPPAVHDKFRVDHSGRGSYDRVIRGLSLLRDAGFPAQVLCVLQPGADGRATYQHFRELGIKRINFLLPDATHDSRTALYGAESAEPVANFLLPAFEAWWAEDDPSVQVQIFVELISALLGGAPRSDSFGNPALGYLIVETDGEIETQDALRVCEHRMGSSGIAVDAHSFDALESASPWVHKVTTQGVPLPSDCEDCRYERVCAGGALPHRYSKARGFDNPSIWCRDIQTVLDRIDAAVCEARA